MLSTLSRLLPQEGRLDVLASIWPWALDCWLDEVALEEPAGAILRTIPWTLEFRARLAWFGVPHALPDFSFAEQNSVRGTRREWFEKFFLEVSMRDTANASDLDLTRDIIETHGTPQQLLDFLVRVATDIDATTVSHPLWLRELATTHPHILYPLIRDETLRGSVPDGIHSVVEHLWLLFAEEAPTAVLREAGELAAASFSSARRVLELVRFQRLGLESARELAVNPDQSVLSRVVDTILYDRRDKSILAAILGQAVQHADVAVLDRIGQSFQQFGFRLRSGADRQPIMLACGVRLATPCDANTQEQLFEVLGWSLDYNSSAFLTICDGLLQSGASLSASAVLTTLRGRGMRSTFVLSRLDIANLASTWASWCHAGYYATPHYDELHYTIGRLGGDVVGYLDELLRAQPPPFESIVTILEALRFERASSQWIRVTRLARGTEMETKVLRAFKIEAGRVREASSVVGELPPAILNRAKFLEELVAKEADPVLRVVQDQARASIAEQGKRWLEGGHL